MNPETNLGILEGGDAYGYVVILLMSLDIHPLVAGVDRDDFALPDLSVWILQTQIDPRPCGARFSIAVLIEEVTGFLGHAAEPVY